ncbi:MAG TPA: DUF3011 domain-containing protein [Patescibacteria group bacterium]|nr:DUF3011 domain-containing protein [Patescibacteria group bacterium]
MRHRILQLLTMLGVGWFAALTPSAALAQPQSKSTAYGLIVCESPNGRESFCPAETRYGVTLRRELSRGKCVQGRTWGTRRDGIWISGGCVGEFVIGSQAPGNNGGYPNPGWNGDPNYSSAVICESINERYNRCSVDTRGGVELSRQLSRGACVAGQTWGYENGFIWVDRGCRGEFEIGRGGYGPPGYGQPGYGDPDWGISGDEYLIRCESINERQAFCPFEVGRANVTLERQLSRGNCMLGRTWNFNPRGIYVSGGCRGEFRVDRGYRPGAGYPGQPGQPGYGGYNVIRCESYNERRNVCAADIRRGARLDRQLSKGVCREGYSWGWDRRGIWVDKGCRGDFVID